ncbi:MAG: c-type cytochrome [Verrucomicrobia bacterium]|nr:c-type cytochrome [Verrucomicrobiota bacterium]
MINSVVTSCGCTTAHLPPMPWTLAPGADGKIDINMNLAGKTGTVIKTITVNSTAGTKMLQFRVMIPDPQAERAANMQLAQADRQAIFKGSCVSCHVTPGEGKTGGELFKAVCGVCHEAAHRASMVPDLHSLNHPTNRDHWRAWITGGKPGSLMPAFQKAQGGPLTEDQINSLVEYLTQAIPSMDAGLPGK